MLENYKKFLDLNHLLNNNIVVIKLFRQYIAFLTLVINNFKKSSLAILEIKKYLISLETTKDRNNILNNKVYLDLKSNLNSFGSEKIIQDFNNDFIIEDTGIKKIKFFIRNIYNLENDNLSDFIEFVIDFDILSYQIIESDISLICIELNEKNNKFLEYIDNLELIKNNLVNKVKSFEFDLESLESYINSIVKNDKLTNEFNNYYI